MKISVCPLTSPSVSMEKLRRAVWSIENQKDSPIDYEINIIVNSLDKNHYPKVKADFPDYNVFDTRSDGYVGRGKNAVIDQYREMYKDRGYTHLMILDGDDFYYPTAFQCIYELGRKSRLDFLSNMQSADSLRNQNNPNWNTARVKENVWLYSLEGHRFGVPPYLYWNGVQCPGGERTLCLSNRAIECDISHLEGPNRADDYFHLCRGIAAYLREELEFVNTDCNDIYIYDSTNPNSICSIEDKGYDAKRGWPFDPGGLVAREIEKKEFHCLKGITRRHLPYVTMPQLMNMREKVKYLLAHLVEEK